MSSDTPHSSPASAPFQGTSPANSGPQSDTTLSEAIITVRKRLPIVILLVVLGLLYGLYRSLKQVPVYEAYGRIEVRAGASNEYKVSAFSGGDDDPQRKMQTEIAIITSETLLTTVAREMNLANSPEFMNVRGPMVHRNLDDPSVREGIVAALAAGLKVAQVAKTDIIRLSYTSRNPKLSADVVNHVISAYIERSFQTRYASTQKVSAWLSGQLGDLKRDVEQSQDKMMDLERRLGTLGFDSTHNQITGSLDDLSKALGAAKLTRIVAESRYRMLTNMDPSAVEGSIDASGTGAGPLEALRGQLATAKAALARLSVNQLDRNPEYITAKVQVDELQRQVNTEQNRLLVQAKETYLLAKNNEDQTNAALEAQKQEAYKLGDDMVQYKLQAGEFESNRTLYSGLLQKLRTAGVEAGLESLEIDIVDPALAPISPQMTSRSTLLVTYGALGLLAGILLAFLLESLDTGLRSVAEIEQLTELPSLAVIPRAKKASPERIAQMTTVERNVNVLTQPKSQFTEAFRSLRTALLLSTTTGQEPKYILFTSATPSEGKTTATGNLAVILAQRGTRTLLIDGDLRRPNVHHRFGINGKVGLSTILSGQTTLTDSVQSVAEVPGLDILASGPVPPFPTEMLASAAMAKLLRDAGEIYSHIVIDSPPILSVTDGVILSRLVDIVVLVVRHGKSSKHVVRRARDLLIRSGAPVAGIVLNAVDLNSPEYYGYYGYSGYSYTSLDTGAWDTKSANQGQSGSQSSSDAGERKSER